MLTKMRVLTEADGIALATLCQAYTTMAKAQTQLSRTGIIFKTPNGFLQQNLLLKVVNQQAEIIIKHLREFGLTPASRSRLIAEEQVSGHEDLLELLSTPSYAKASGSPGQLNNIALN
jgi:P27 family predicted phage terminase small subunit